MNTEKLLAQLVERLLEAYGRDLRAAILYGSAATGEFDDRHSDLNVLCVLRGLDVDKLEKSEAIANWWRGRGHPAPLLLSDQELEHASDSFAIEFLDIQQQHRLLHGEDLVSRLSITPGYHRVQVEHELRAKLLALRQRYLGIHRDRKAVVRLMMDALPSFSALFRHALILAGEQPELRRPEIFARAGTRFGFDPAPFLAVLELRRGQRRPSAVNARATFSAYYNGILRVIEAVDGFENKE
jgi:hypothetical protein